MILFLLRAIGAAALAILAGVPSGAAAQTTPDTGCLWSALPADAQLRLELAAKTRGGFTADDIAGIGEDRVIDVLLFCGFQPTPTSVDVMAKFWAAKASLSARAAEARSAGLDLAEADAALFASAPAVRLPSFAAEIAARVNGAAAAAVREAMARYQTVSPPASTEQRRALAEYLAARLLADGLAATAPPPQ